jgi:hypothetical protein
MFSRDDHAGPSALRQAPQADRPVTSRNGTTRRAKRMYLALLLTVLVLLLNIIATLKDMPIFFFANN